MAGLVEAWLRGVDATFLTNLFLFVLLGVMTFAVYCKRKHKINALTAYTPTLLTSLGILGTFAGIITGLLDFDTQNIDGSIGPLLEGLKTAFISSLAGMLLSILYKVWVASGWLIPEPEELAAGEEISDVDFYKLMKSQSESIDQLRKSIAEDTDSSLVNLLKLQRSDANDYYSYMRSKHELFDDRLNKLLTLSELRQQEFKLFQTQLWQKLTEFADMMSKSATEQVIEALKAVIVDFNNNLVEQFGDNFKALNASVEKLVEWQDNYKSQLADMAEKYALGVKSITATESSVANISEATGTIPATMIELKQVLEVNQHQISELNRHLSAFKDIRDKAVDAVPEIRSQIEQTLLGAKASNEAIRHGLAEYNQQMTSVLKESTDKFGDTLSQVGDNVIKNVKESTASMARDLADSSEEFNDSIRKVNAAVLEASQASANANEQIKDMFSSAFEDISQNMRDLLNQMTEGGNELNTSYKSAGEELMHETQKWNEEFSKQVQGVTRELESTISKQAENHQQQANQIFRSLETTIQKALDDTGESVQKQVDMIDKTAGQEIEKVMKAMGSALAAISNQFTQDYQRLVEQMNRVVNQR